MANDADQESWQTAKGISQYAGLVPPSFSVAIRLLVTDQQKNNGQIRPVTKYQVGRLLQTPTFKSMMYAATKALKPDSLPKGKRVTVGTLMDQFCAFDVASLIGGFLFYRKTKKLLPDELRSAVMKELGLDPQIGAHVGNAMPSIGIGYGILAGLVPCVALGAMVLAAPERWKVYKKWLRENGDKKSLDQERSIWCCSSLQVGVYLCSSLGFGIEVGNAFANGLAANPATAKPADATTRRFLFARLWIDEMKLGKPQPTINIPGDYYPLASLKETLKAKVDATLAGAPMWFDATKDDISPEKTPELFMKHEGGDEVPEGLAEVFSVEELGSMEEEAFDQLVDQIDAEQTGGKSKSGHSVPSGELKDLEGMVE